MQIEISLKLTISWDNPITYDMARAYQKAHGKYIRTNQWKDITSITELIPEIMHELIEKIIVHASDKSSGYREQKVEIHFRFKAANSIAVTDS